MGIPGFQKFERSPAHAAPTRRVIIACLGCWLAPRVEGEESRTAPLLQVPKPKPMDLCPVCGMIVAKFPNWIAAVVWADGKVHYFDGAKDLFKFLLQLQKYAPGRQPGAVRNIVVTEFYDLTQIDGRKAYFVAGSDVTGPMGHELIPLASRADALDFQREHRGKRIFEYPQVTLEVVDRVERGRF